MTEVMDEGTGTPSHKELPPPPARYTLSLIEIRSYLYVSRRKVSTRKGSVEELSAFARQVRTRNLLLGWWGFPFGLIWTPMALVANSKALRKLKGLGAAGVPAAGWFPDPSGRHGARYWDGSEWTDRVSDISSDALPTEATGAG